jgi:ferritin-like metal-binding protein YciE
MKTTLESLSDGILDQIKDLYSAEQQLLKAIPKMEKKASNPKLKEIFRVHLRETEDQVHRLEEIAKLLDEDLPGKPCLAMQGLIKEGEEVLGHESENKALVDVLLIGAAQRIEHYEMASYGTAHAIAVELGQNEIAKLLEDTLEEETRSDKKLSALLKGEVLAQANLDSAPEVTPGKDKADLSQKAQSQKGAAATARIFRLVTCLAIGHQYESLAYAETQQSRSNNEAEASTYKRDNSGTNIRDRNDSRATSDNQKMGGPELKVLARIRQEIIANEALSTNAQNIKIIVQSNTVILRGPVHSIEERAWIQKATARTAAGYNVDNQLEIAPG